MANHYLQFSEVLPQLTEEEERWLRHQLEFVLVFGDTEYAKADMPDNLDPADAEWEGCRVFRDMDGYERDFGEDVGFGYRFADDLQDSWGRHFWLYAEEGGGGCVDRVAHLVQKFLREFRSDRCWSLTYATTCSKPRVGEFSGGALFVTADDIKWHSACEVVEQERAAFSKPKDAHKPQGVLNTSDGPVPDERELATVLTALRFWQRLGPGQPNSFFDRLSIDEQHALDAIRTGCGKFTGLDDAEIDRLCERLNRAAADPKMQYMTAVLSDGAQNQTRSLTVRVVSDDSTILAFPEGYGDFSSADGQGCPLYLELYGGRVRLIAFPDINEQDPLIIDLEEAREDRRIATEHPAGK